MKYIYQIVLILLLFGYFCSCDKTNELNVTGSLYGSVTDKATGGPVKYAKVEIMQTGMSVITGSDGLFEFPKVEAGIYNLYVTKSGYLEYQTTDILVNEDSKDKPVHILLEKLPPALQIVDDTRHEIDSIIFGEVEGDEMRSFMIYNNSEDALEWEIVYKTDGWIKSFSKEAGNLAAGKSQAVVVTIDRTKLNSGYNSTVVHIVSNNGSKQLTITAVSISLIETLAVTEITPSSAVLNGRFNKKATSSIVEYGFVYGTMPTPSLDNGATKVVIKGTAHVGDYSYAISELTNGETYFVRAFATTGNEEYYGETQSFTAQEVPYVTLLPANLMVQKTNLGCVDRSSAITMCESSIVGGYDDWRLPSIEELMVVYNEREKIGGLCDDEIIAYNVSYDVTIDRAYAPYWSSTKKSGNSSEYYYFMSFEDGTQNLTSYNYNKMFVRAVRTIK